MIGCWMCDVMLLKGLFTPNSLEMRKCVEYPFLVMSAKAIAKLSVLVEPRSWLLFNN